MSTVLDALDFVMLALFFSAITVCLLIYGGRRSKAFLAIGVYFIIQVLLELDVRRTEVDNPLARWIEQFFSRPDLIKGLIYGCLVFVMMLAALFILKKDPKPVHFILPCAVLIWLVLICGLSSFSNLIVYSTFLLPCEIFYFGVALFVLKHIKNENSRYYSVLKTVMKLIMVFSVFIALEDVIAALYYGYTTDNSSFIISTKGMHLKNRNVSENLLQIILALIAIGSAGREITGALHACSVPGASAGAAEPDTDAFAAHLGLSPRERDVLPLLLTNMDMNQISEKLIISYGTVKSHTHNIYRKAGVQNRLALMKRAEEFRASPQKPQ